MNLECTYQSPRPTKKDQSMTVAINAIRRLESKIENLTAAVQASKPPPIPSHGFEHHSPLSIHSQPSPGTFANGVPNSLSRHDRGSVHEIGVSPQSMGPQTTVAYGISEAPRKISLSFSQHGVSLWPAVKQILPPAFTEARAALATDYVVECETQRTPLSIRIDTPYRAPSVLWLPALPLSSIKGLSDAYFAVFNRSNPLLDKQHFFSTTLGCAMETKFGYDIEACLVLLVCALGCLAVKAHEEGNFPLPSRSHLPGRGFVPPKWYELILEEPPGLKFFNEARMRIGLLVCQNDLQTGQVWMLQTAYYAQILRPIESWTTVNRAALCCTSMLKRNDAMDFDQWEGDMFCRLFWNTLMYETIITQELNLPLSGVQEYEPDVPIPKFTSCPQPETSIPGPLVDDDDSFFNFHFLAQAAHRILLTRIRHLLYEFTESEGSPTAALTAEIHHQLEQWRGNLPPALQFAEGDTINDDSPSPARVIAKDMLRSRYLVAKYHSGRSFLYKALHFPQHVNDSEYARIAEALKDGMYWPSTMGRCTQMQSALPLKFGWCCQCFGQILLLHTVARSPDPKLREALPDGWQSWVRIMVELITKCAEYSPAIAKDAELVRLLDWP
ncbi:C6 zinc finger domain-containing protein [Polyplosphaeria fusca]|uniref:C6 zinc finger domain-containing protein n=1 Tax=Polyplosphaeria fusca TaxID=682080 RepID=A0A9P4QQZ8_9PLEO|nr:C6 zinc finger domain-containing protein [Polyplosphaeria fusca]